MEPPSLATLKRYHLTEESWRRLGEAQGWRCAVCGGPAKTRFVIDHCHRTHRVRGLVHPMCNGKLGKIQDSATWAESAAAYLRSPIGYSVLTESEGYVNLKVRTKKRRRS